MIDLSVIQTPIYICEESKLQHNLEILNTIKSASGAKIILALKGFAMHSTFNLVSRYLDGCCASGLFEAKLASEKMGKEVHTYSPAYCDDDIEEIARISDHIVFNSPTQLERYAPYAKKINSNIEISLRVNPQHSSAKTALYDPCAPYSRLGTTIENFNSSIISNIDGLNFHALCEQDADDLEAVLGAFEAQFGHLIHKLKFVNFGGGHHITKEGYDREKLVSIIKNFKRKYGDIEVYLEPGEAVGWQCGYLVATVLDIVDNGKKIAILDTSAEAHMPDTLAMPYRAEVRDSSYAQVKRFTYTLAGNTCLAGDIMGEYSFDTPLSVGDRVVFEDQIHYTFVKNTTFNGIKLPSLAIVKKSGELEIVKEFGYSDYRDRLS